MRIASRNWWPLAGLVLLVSQLSFASGVLGDETAGCGVCKGCLYGVDGICIPRRISYGFYETRWRRWPAEPKEKVPEAEEPSAELENVPTGEVPQSIEEGDALPSLPGRPIRGPKSRQVPPTKEDRDRYERDLRENPFRDDPGPPADSPQSIRTTSAVSRASYVTPEQILHSANVTSDLMSPGLTELASSARTLPSNGAIPSQVEPRAIPLSRSASHGVTVHGRFNPLRVGESKLPTIVASEVEDSANTRSVATSMFDPSLIQSGESAARRNPLRQ